MLEVFEPQFVGCRCRQCRYSKTVTPTGGLGQWPHSWKKEMISKTTFPNDVKFPSVLFTLNMFPSCSIPIFLAETPPCVFHNCVLLGPSPPTKMNINCQGVRISRDEIGTPQILSQGQHRWIVSLISKLCAELRGFKIQYITGRKQSHL